MSTKIKALICLFLVGILVGACGRKFRAIDESDAIESRAILLANQHFSTLFDTDQEYQDHVQLRSELMALQFISKSEVGGLAVNVAENDCTTVDIGAVEYSNESIFQSVTPGQSLPLQGQNGYSFNAVCIPTSLGGQQQCAHFLIAVQKTYATGRKGSAYAVVSYDEVGKKWENLEMSGNFSYAVNLRTFDQVQASFSCRQNTQSSTSVLSGTENNSDGSSIWDVAKDAILDWAVNEAQERWDSWFGSDDEENVATPSIIPTTPTTDVPNTTTPSLPNQSETFPGMGGDTFDPPTTSDPIFDFDESVNPFPLEDANDDQSEYCFESGAC